MSARTLHLQEDDRFYYDAAAADRVIRFIERYCVHFEGRFAGQPFKLLDWQKDEIIRPLFGWKRRSDGLRRFRELYLLSAKGAGKTPLLAGIGLYMLLGDEEAGAHVVSTASSFEQANLTFDMAKKYVGNSATLSKHAEPKQYHIAAKKHGKWTIASGKPTGRSGSRPSCIIGSELHEWTGAAVKSFELLTANLFKRTQPLLLDTNAGTDRGSFAWQQHERATKVLDGRCDEGTLLPVIYEAPIEIEWTSEEAAAAANPSLGKIVKFEQLSPQLEKAKADPGREAEYRRLYLSQWSQDGGKKWLDVTMWDACTGIIDPAIIKDAPLYVGIDLSQDDDLCAVVYVWATPEKLYVRTKFWLPKSTADHYQLKEAVPYKAWADAGAIELISENTISNDVKKRIAASIVEVHKTRKIKAVCYDRYKADEAIAALEGENVVCVPVAQGYSVTPGCAELVRRLKEKSLVIEANPVMRWNAESVEVKVDDRGNFWPVKPNAKGTYAGKRGSKIDGIAALVTALTEARKNSFPSARKMWQGKIVSI